MRREALCLAGIVEAADAVGRFVKGIEKVTRGADVDILSGELVGWPEGVRPCGWAQIGIL